MGDDSGMAVPPLQAERQLQDQAFALWAIDRGVTPGEILAAQADQGLLSLSEALMIRGALSLSEVGELLEHSTHVACPGCET